MITRGTQPTYLHSWPSESLHRPLVIAHRGGRFPGTPENSIEAVERAIELKTTHIEVDVRKDALRAAVLSHDVPKPNESPPTLEEALTGFPNTFFRLDIKDVGAAREAARLVKATGSQQRVYISSLWDHRIAIAAHLLEPPVERAYGILLGSTAALFALLGLPWRTKVRWTRAYHAHVILARSRFAPTVFRRLGGRGIFVHVWTVNKTDDIMRCADLGVDGILTDKPGLVHDVLDSTGTL